MTQNTITSTTQDFLDIHDITNDLVIMKDGSAAAILAVSAMNFSLLAEEEQDAVIYAYAALLNSLNFQIQINIQSKTKDATVYLDLLKKREETVSSNEKRKQIARYREFIGELIQERNVLDKKFYVVIPAAALELGIVPPQSIMPGAKTLDIGNIEKSVLLDKATGVLSPRVDHLVGQFNRIGLFARQIATQEIIQNFYMNYNPEAVEGQQITEADDYTTPLVQASMVSASLQNRNQAIKQFSQNPNSSLEDVAPAQSVQAEVLPAGYPALVAAPVEYSPAPEAFVESPALETVAEIPPSAEFMASFTPSVSTTQEIAPQEIQSALPDQTGFVSPNPELQPLPQIDAVQTAQPTAAASPIAPNPPQSYSLPPLPEIS